MEAASVLSASQQHQSLLYPNPVLSIVQLSEQQLKSEPEEKRADFLRGRIFPEHLTSDAQPKVEQLGSWGQVAWVVSTCKNHDDNAALV